MKTPTGTQPGGGAAAADRPTAEKTEAAQTGAMLRNLRPDAVDWRCDQIVATDIAPRAWFYGRIQRWLVASLALQLLLALSVLAALLGPWRAWQRDPRGQVLAQVLAAAAGDDLRQGRLGQGGAVLAALGGAADVAVVEVRDGQDATLFRFRDDALAASVPPHLLSPPTGGGAMASDWRGWVAHHAAVPAGAGDSLALTLVMRDSPSLRVAVEGGLAATAAFLLVCPLAWGVVRSRLARQRLAMSELLAAVRRLASGASPRPLVVRDFRESGYLAVAFNDMAAKLVAGRDALLEANDQLEARVAQRTAELEEATRKLDQMASTDGLTGLANRRRLDEEFRARFDRARRLGDELACMLLDLDGFKAVNDQLGHKRGDELLVLASQVLREGCRPQDVVARFGGDEFVVLLDRADADAACVVADRIQRIFQAKMEQLLADATLPRLPSMSFGIASARANGVSSCEQLLSLADQALYESKSAGKARATIFRPPPVAA